MNLESTTINSSIVTESIGGNAQIDNRGAVNTFNNAGNIYQGCQINLGPGWEELSKLSASVLDKAQTLLLKGQDEDCLSFLDDLLKPDYLSNPDSETKFKAISIYLDILFFKARYDDGLSLLKTTLGGLSEDYRVKAWTALFRVKKSDGDAQEDLRALLKLYSESPTVLHIALLSEDAKLAEDSIKALDRILESHSEPNKFRRPLITYAALLANGGDPRLALKVIEKVTSSDEVETYKIRCYRLSFECSILLKNEVLASGFHTTLDEWLQLEEIANECEKIILESKKHNHEFLDPYELKALALGLQRKVLDAIDAIPSSLEPKLSDWGIRNRINNFQTLGRWPDIENLIKKLPPDRKKEFLEGEVISLINQDRFEEARVLAQDSPQQSLILAIKSPDQVPLQNLMESTGKFFVASQVAVQRYLEKGDPDAKAFLINFSPTDKVDEFVKAESLAKCNLSDESLDILRSIFGNAPIGVSPLYTHYLRLLLRKGERARVSGLLNQTPERIIYQDRRLLNLYVDFKKLTSNLKDAYKVIKRAHDEFPDIASKILVLQQLLQLGDLDLFRELVLQWGLEPEGEPENVALYLALVGRYLTFDLVAEPVYKLLLANHANISVLQSVFSLLFTSDNSTTKDDSNCPQSIVSPCAVVLRSKSGGNTQFLIDDRKEATATTLAYGSNDEAVADLIGKKTGDTISFESTEQVIAEIVSVNVWMFRFCVTELSKRPKKTSVKLVTSESKEEFVEKLVQMANESGDSYKNLLTTITANSAPLMLFLTMSDANPIEAWARFHRNPHNIFTTCSVVTEGSSNSLINSNTLVLDATAICDIFFSPPDKLTNILDMASFAVTPSLYGLLRELEINEARLISSNLVETAKILCDQIRTGKISVVEPIPGSDLTGEDIKVVSYLDQTTQDSMLACYRNGNRILITDDTKLSHYANSLGIRSLTSFQVLHDLTSNDVPGNSYPLMAPVFVAAEGAVKPNALSVKMILSLACSNRTADEIKRFVEEILQSIPFSKENIAIVAILMDIRDTLYGEFPNLEILIDVLLSLFAKVLPSRARQFQLIKNATDVFPYEAQCKHALRILSHFSPLPLEGPYSNIYTFRILMHRYKNWDLV